MAENTQTPEPPPFEVTALLDLHRHEDILFDRRLYSLLVSTAFLIAGFAQFRERPYFLLALAICFAGATISLLFGLILRRTAAGIVWSNAQIRTSRVGAAAIYSARDAALGAGPSASRRLVSVAWLLLALWIALAALLAAKHAFDCSKYVQCPWFS